ncbi:MerC domain-containing protein [Stenotrophomonas maltophilia]|uniref:MerC domain-containing protein n=1 Tax=Stenotrophomonas TaxID=40323 RepID=UPI0013114BA3|nr:MULTISPECIES: MerC domain-containing protein [Stenotrophomonas]MBH1591286.1 MerC domain-containing protein [Stenotrophomonas maltophilia]MBH1664137.1 MerC domain-containing protein [Stenotrophomonas maltophilia]MCO7400086.1 MerC domain-containing protein [Stenotrophomonas maltophilia]MCO7411245.1 MerC domain-containing protein [Stenotrophomonas maltophilia]MCU1091489.1 MerC domain-containing protein [Stenotrophomonas maltophilia]
MKSPSPALLDAGALALSSLCLLHCLALPLLAAALPLFGAWAQAEWVHLLFVAIALPLTGYALWRADRRHRLPVMAWTAAGLGLGLLLAGALELPSHAWETPLTVTGSLLLAATHIWNARRRHRHC